MPKTFPNARKERWLAQYSQGKTIKQIAAKAECDMRTVKRAIEEMRGRRAAQEAMAQLYREALLSHIDRLNSALDSIIDGLRMPDPYFTELAWTQLCATAVASRETAEAEKDGGDGRERGDDVLSYGALLAEHLKNSKAWRALGECNRSLKRHRTACGKLQEQALSLLKQLTGLKAREEGRVASGSFFHGENTGDLLCRTVVKQLCGGPTIETVTNKVSIDIDRGVLLYGGMVLAEGIKESQALSQCRDSIVKAFGALAESPQAMQLLKDFRQVEKVLPVARNELRAVRLLGVLPGQCRVCRQFGL